MPVKWGGHSVVRALAPPRGVIVPQTGCPGVWSHLFLFLCVRGHWSRSLNSCDQILKAIEPSLPEHTSVLSPVRITLTILEMTDTCNQACATASAVHITVQRSYQTGSRVLMFFWPFPFFSPPCLFSSPGKANTHRLCSCFSDGNCWTVCAPLLVFIAWIVMREAGEPSVNKWMVSAQTDEPAEWDKRRECSWAHTHTHTRTHTHPLVLLPLWGLFIGVMFCPAPLP